MSYAALVELSPGQSGSAGGLDVTFQGANPVRCASKPAGRVRSDPRWLRTASVRLRPASSPGAPCAVPPARPSRAGLRARGSRARLPLSPGSSWSTPSEGSIILRLRAGGPEELVALLEDPWSGASLEALGYRYRVLNTPDLSPRRVRIEVPGTR